MKLRRRIEKKAEDANNFKEESIRRLNLLDVPNADNDDVYRS